MIVCCGEALIDLIRPTGLAEGFLPLPGGSPFNTAVAIGKLGVPVKYLGKLSTDFFGEILAKRMRDNRIGEELVSRTALNSSLAFVKIEKNKEPQYIFYCENTADLSLKTDELPAKLPADTSCILFGSFAMTIEPIASAIEALILREATRKSADQMDGAPVISFDPNIRPVMIKNRDAYRERFEKWIAASTIAKISMADFEYIYPKMGLEQAMQKILTMGPRLVIGTMGPKGSTALLRRNDGSVLKVSAPSVDLPVVDTIGAGDTFHGAFLAWLELKGKMSRSTLVGLNEAELYNALFFANKAASIVCSRQGAEPPTRREVESLKIPEQKVVEKKTAAKKPEIKAEAKQAAKPAPAKTSAVKPPAVKSAAKPAAKPAAKKTAVKEPAAAKPAAAKKPAAKSQPAKKPAPKKK